MSRSIKRFMAFLIAVSLLVTASGSVALAQSPAQEESVKAGKMVADVLLVRPLSLASTVLGTAAFAVALPFSILGGNVKESARKLVLEPAKFTFARPLGDF